jgi:lysylphosphatidylglycerol synthetase-like protein (DUF2156 family)
VGAQSPAPPRPDQRHRRLPASSWLKLAGAVAVAVAAILLFPRSGGDAPPLASLALIGAVVTGVTTAALYAIARRDLRLPWRAAISLAIAFALIGLVKFVLAPFGLYQVNATRALTDQFGTVADPTGAVITAATVLGLYALGYAIVYWFGGDNPPVRRRSHDRDRAPVRARTILGVLLIAGFVAVSGLWIVAFIVLTAPLQYLEFVFSSAAGVVVAVSLLVAATLIGSTFRTLSDLQTPVEFGTIVTLFWVGLGFLALYHVLWIVYVLVLGSIWPLKTVVPK